MFLRIALTFLCASAQTTPAITAAGWTQGACPEAPGVGGVSLLSALLSTIGQYFSRAKRAKVHASQCIFFNVVGNDFGASQGELQKGDFLPPAPPPPPMPWDTPLDLLPSNLATRTGGNGVCVARSLYTGDGFHYVSFDAKHPCAPKTPPRKNKPEPEPYTP